MIGVKGQYQYRFNIATAGVVVLEEFIQEEDLISFKVTEEVGNVLPTFSLSFQSTNENIMKYLNEGNDLQVSFGRSSYEFIAKLYIAKATISRSADNKRTVYVAGMYSATPFMFEPKKFMSESLSGLEVLQTLVAPSFSKIDSNVTASEEKQVWIQPYQTDKNFADQLYLHSDITSSFTAVGISFQGEYIIRDIKKLLGTSYKWNFTKKSSADNEIAYSGDAAIEYDSGLMNYLIGYGREKLVHDLNAGTSTTVLEDVQPLLANARSMIRRSDVSKLASKASLITSNTHSNYWTAYLRNLTHLATFSTYRVTLTYVDKLYGLRLLDLVQFKDDSTNNAKKESSVDGSGLYLISRIQREVKNRSIKTTVMLVREAPSVLKGDLR